VVLGLEKLSEKPYQLAAGPKLFYVVDASRSDTIIITAKIDNGRISHPMQRFRVHQIFYDMPSRAALDPGFIPLDNTKTAGRIGSSSGRFYNSYDQVA